MNTCIGPPPLSAAENIPALVAQGYRVIQSESCWWYNEYRQERFYSAFPLHRLISPSSEEIRSVFRSLPAKVLGLRFLAPATSQGAPSALWICEGKYDYERLPSKIRNQVRRGLRECTVRAVGWEELLAKGWEAQQDTNARHGRKTTSLGLDARVGKCPAYEAWGAFVGEELAAY